MDRIPAATTATTAQTSQYPLTELALKASIAPAVTAAIVAQASVSR